MWLPGGFCLCWYMWAQAVGPLASMVSVTPVTNGDSILYTTYTPMIGPGGFF
jgi:hypothetical protein